MVLQTDKKRSRCMRVLQVATPAQQGVTPGEAISLQTKFSKKGPMKIFFQGQFKVLGPFFCQDYVTLYPFTFSQGKINKVTFFYTFSINRYLKN